MDVSPTPPLRAKILAWAPFVLSAALVAMAIRTAAREPLTAALFATLFVLMMLPSYLARRRVRDVLRSGDVHSVLSAWSGNIERLPYPETMGPLITAAAFASCGWVEQARTALGRSVRGPAWEAALEHRLFVETLLDAFEGDREGALTKASRLSSLPLPLAGPFMQGRVRILRDALAAFARAFAHTSTPQDMRLLERASKKSPLVHWAMRYAAAVVAVDHGKLVHAKKLLDQAPEWPKGSAFHSFHEELLGVIADG
ncbi:MAG TPA: hypothetical protein VF881_09890 [Polyangiaceae bacterium]